MLKPYVLEAPDHIVPILFLDSYRCHSMMASVVGKIQELGVKVEHIPDSWGGGGGVQVFVNQLMWA